MAKHSETAPSVHKVEPKASISWPSAERTEGKKGVKLMGDMSGMALGKHCKLSLEGTVTGFRMDEYGGSIDLTTKNIKIENVRDAKGDEDEEPMTDMVDRLQGKKKKG